MQVYFDFVKTTLASNLLLLQCLISQIESDNILILKLKQLDLKKTVLLVTFVPLAKIVNK